MALQSLYKRIVAGNRQKLWVIIEIRVLMKKHYLYEVNLERQTAFCVVCGYTEIHVAKLRIRTTPLVYCIKRAEELGQYKRSRYAPRNTKNIRPTYEQWHRLTAIDTEMRTAICSICGPTDVYIDNSRRTVAYRCANQVRNYGKKSADPHHANRMETPVPDPKKQHLEENKKIVHDYKRRQTCKRCNVWALVPEEFSFFELQFPREQRISRRIRVLSAEDLLIELEKRDLYCKRCYKIVCKEFRQNSSALAAKGISI